MNTKRHRTLSKLAALVTAAAISPCLWAQAVVTVTNTADSGTGSLRQAIQDANFKPDRTTIRFAIGGTGPFVIAPRSEFQEFTAPVIIQGYSQPGSVAPTTQGNGTIMIEIDAGAIPDVVDNTGGTFTFVRGAERSAVSGISFTGSNGTRVRTGVLALADDVRVSANYFGLRPDGMTLNRLDSAFGGLCADRLIFGGARPSDGNLIAGTDSSAVLLTGTGHQIENNWFGMDHFGKTAFTNVIAGYAIVAGKIAYGAPRRLARTYSVAVQQSYFGLRSGRIANNRVTQTTDSAIALIDSMTHDNLIANNVLGQDIWNTRGPNLSGGIRLTRGTAMNTVVDNRITYSNFGILLGNALVSPPESAGVGNALSRNLIGEVADGLIGLDANNHFAPLVNDALDADIGANNLQNKPVLTYANQAGRVEFALQSEANKTYRVEFFMANTCHPGGFGGSDMFLGDTVVSTDGGGRVSAIAQTTNAPFGGLRPGTFMTATASEMADLDGNGTPETSINTSEFSSCQPIAALIPTTTVVNSLPAYVPATDPSVKLSATVTAGSGSPTGDVVFFLDTDRRSTQLGTATLSGTVATLALQEPLKQTGNYTIRAEYRGDARFRPSDARRGVIVFRPASALVDYRLTSITRRKVGASDFEVANPAGGWINVTAPTGARYLDATQYRDERLDRIISTDPANDDFLLYNVTGNSVDPVVSNFVKSTDPITDFTQFGADSRMDALTVDTARGAPNMVSCVFDRDICERLDKLDPKPEFRVTLTGDFNGDGRHDLLWRDPSGSRTYVWLMDGATRLDEIQNPAVPSGLQAVAAGDFNGDGIEDIVWYDETQGAVEIWYMVSGKMVDRAVDRSRGGRHFVMGPAHLGVAGSTDYGRAGLVWFDQSSGEVFVWRDMVNSGGRVSYNPQTIYIDSGYGPFKTR